MATYVCFVLGTRTRQTVTDVTRENLNTALTGRFLDGYEIGMWRFSKTSEDGRTVTHSKVIAFYGGYQREHSVEGCWLIEEVQATRCCDCGCAHCDDCQCCCKTCGDCGDCLCCCEHAED
jgi:hypothetical protein